MRRTRLFALIAAVSALFALGAAGSARADYHKIKIREISGTGDMVNVDDAYIVLQMYRPGQTQLAGHSVTLYDDQGAAGPSFPLGNVPRGQNQRTILIGDDNVAGADFTAQMGVLSPMGGFGAAGAACFDDIDCVSWGGPLFIGENALPSPTQPYPDGLPVNQSLHRKIGKRCRTALDPQDDTNDAATDFRLAERRPRNNAQKPLERVCVPCGGRLSTITGTNGKNRLKGTKGRDYIAGLGGNDVLLGRGGNDVLCGGRGKDRLFGGPGRDRLFGGPGRDFLAGGPGLDILRGGPGRDRQRQ